LGGNNMDDKDLLLKEWAVRYQSYHQYRGQYVVVLSIGLTLWVLTVVYTSIRIANSFHKLVILFILCIIGIVIILAHHVALSSIKKLGERIEVLESKVGIEPFRTTRLLDIALRISLSGSWLTEFITIALFFYALLSV
jgi:hypothetical protein